MNDNHLQTIWIRIISESKCKLHKIGKLVCLALSHADNWAKLQKTTMSLFGRYNHANIYIFRSTSEVCRSSGASLFFRQSPYSLTRWTNLFADTWKYGWISTGRALHKRDNIYRRTCGSHKRRARTQWINRAVSAPPSVFSSRRA